MCPLQQKKLNTTLTHLGEQPIIHASDLAQNINPS